jgi:protein subunit release factor A
MKNNMETKQLLFSLSAKDFKFETFCTGGNGGQHKNAKQNGVRCIHPASGARAEHRDGRDQFRNKREAFRKMAETKEFKAWHKVECMRRLGQLKEVEKAVDAAMSPENIKIEYIQPK